MYEEQQTLLTFKAQLVGIPRYPALGNHDSFPSDQNNPYWWAQNGTVDEFQWEYEFYPGLWTQNRWISAAKQGRAHYGAYNTVTIQGLKIISMNTDFWYKNIFFNYVNTTNPYNSGMLQFLTDELQACEDCGQNTVCEFESKQFTVRRHSYILHSAKSIRSFPKTYADSGSATFVVPQVISIPLSSLAFRRGFRGCPWNLCTARMTPGFPKLHLRASDFSVAQGTVDYIRMRTPSNLHVVAGAK